MKIEKINGLKGAEKYGACNECGKSSQEYAIFRITTTNTCLCLCAKHVQMLKSKLFYLENKSYTDKSGIGYADQPTLRSAT